MRKIVVATNNSGKLREIKEILNNYEIISLKDLKLKINVVEDGKTFKENALKKAREVFKVTNIPSVADDSGLCIEVLEGFPGINTARFLGEDATDDDRNNYILEKMEDKKESERTAEVVCSIAYVDGENEYVVEGSIEGKIPYQKRGNNGFGFDPVFELENGKTLAELEDYEKNNVSSRKIALEKLKKLLESTEISRKNNDFKNKLETVDF